MITWKQFSNEAPETAGVFERRLAATGLGLVATTRTDGYPRISPVEPLLAGDRLWLGMMPGSTKSRDLRRDPRLCLHSATADKELNDGDAKLWGRAVLADDDDTRRRYAAAFREATGNDLDELPSGFDLYWLELTGGSSVVLGDDREHLRITHWTPGSPERITKRT